MPPSIAISAPNEAAIVANTTLATNSDTEDENDHTGPNTPTPNGSSECLGLPWQGIDLSRVPSYTTAIRSNRLYSFSGSLPGYDSVVAVPGRSG